MLPSRLFRSRWSALFWAGGILWTAYDVAMANRPTPVANVAEPAPVRDAAGEAVNAADLAIVANLAD